MEDCASRYQHDIHRYPSQYTRLKKERWNHLKREWMTANRTVPESDTDEAEEDWFYESEKNVFTQALDRLKNFSVKRKHVVPEFNMNIEDSNFSLYEGRSREDIIDIFYEELFLAQLKWASSSLLEESSLNPKFKYDQLLRYLLRELPDNYFVLYYPIFSVRNAPIEMDVILISPAEIICLTILEGKHNSVFESSSGRFWNEYVDQQIKRKVNPVVSLNRMGSILREILKNNEAALPVRYAVWSPASLIDNRSSGLKVELIDRRSHENWLAKLKRQPSPIKSTQLKIADMLLENTITVSFRREDLFHRGENDFDE
ncbi:nuclease-related domain-containing protein [Alteribacillus sp. HJP-4]